MTGEGRPRGRPARISRQQIVDAALGADNLDALSMRELAATLGVTHSALYRWVGDRDELMDLVNDVMVERVLAAAGPRAAHWRAWLARLGWAMQDNFLSVAGYASHLARPHRHTTSAFDRLRSEVVAAFTDAGVEADLAEQSWYIFVTGVVSWLATHEKPMHMGAAPPRFELFLDALLRGLPAQEPVPGSDAMRGPERIAGARGGTAAGEE